MINPSQSSCFLQALPRRAPGRTTQPEAERTRLPLSLALVLAVALVVGVSACSTVTGATGTSSTSLSGQPTAQATQATTLSGQPTTQATQSTTQTTPTTSATTPASPGVNQVANMETLRGGAAGSVTATCPQGEIALGGGWTIPTTGTHVYAATVNGNSWTVSVSPQTVPFEPIDVTAYVECLAGEPTAVVTSRATTYTVPYTPQYGQVHLVPCQANEFPVGYGFDFGAADAKLELQATVPETVLGSPELWWFTVANHDSQPHTITIYADCLSNVHATASYVHGQQSVGAYVNQGASDAVSCPAGTALAGGGVSYAYQGQNGFGNIDTTYFVSRFGPTGHYAEWLTTVLVTSLGGTQPLQPVANAVCLSFS